MYSKVFVGRSLKYNVREIWKFASGGECFWRVILTDGHAFEGDSAKIRVCTSCLSDKTSKNTFAYLRHVAFVNPLGKDKDSDGILADMYDKVDFVDSETAAACYLNPNKYKPKTLNCSDLIYPFGCNASQKTAVAAAFKHQMSVIQGPPGTGKTQTILNIIANIVRQGKTVLVVSNNNSATANVQEKLEKYGTSFIVAPLGSRENKEKFIANQPLVPTECFSWELPFYEIISKSQMLHTTLQRLDKVFALQNERAKLLQEQQAVGLEWKHFCMDNGIGESVKTPHRVSSKSIMRLWLNYQVYANGEKPEPTNFFSRWIEQIRTWWMEWLCKHRLHVENKVDKNNFGPLVKELQMLYYLNRQIEIKKRIGSVEKELSSYDAKKLVNALTELSMSLFKSSLSEHYKKHKRLNFATVNELRRCGEEFMKQYPVVLSTTFSARSCIFTDKPYDYIIMDEASQVSIDTGALALTCARNAVIVGDTLQLPNVVTDEDREKLNVIMRQYNISQGYDCAKNSFLQSVLDVIMDVPETLLREHYRCHPRIINFCNQKFYGGNLLIMTEDKGENDVLSAIRTVKGNHAVNHYNQREIDVVKEEVLPKLKDFDSIGIVTPYNNQVDAFNNQLDRVKAGTIHKYQGRENDAIIMSVVDNQITEFADDPNMLNVAVSRAKKKFCLVMTGNEQEKHGNITDLLDYIAYNNCTVTESKLASIFDYLYEQYTEQRMAFLKSHPQISEFASENLTYNMLVNVVASDPRFKVLNVLCHIPLREVVKDTSLMNEDELKYAGNYNTHLDFLIINRVSKQPVVAIETDGYSYHNEETDQHRRDLMKDHILSNYGLPLLRLSTKGSGERTKVVELLNTLI
ncbi:DUF2726 domain-containing protein [Hallella sp. CLA-AA-H145]|nr:DUF2726 domain-containing protein [Hallella faecis]